MTSNEQVPSEKRCLEPEDCLRGVQGECFPCDHGERLTSDQEVEIVYDRLVGLGWLPPSDAAALRRERDLYKFQAETNAETIKNMRGYIARTAVTGGRERA